ncbi:MAG: family 20 glycosylhydrolase [Bacteroides sp.]
MRNIALFTKPLALRLQTALSHATLLQLTLFTLLLPALFTLSSCNDSARQQPINCTPTPNYYQANRGTFSWLPSTPLLIDPKADESIIRTALETFRPEAPLTMQTADAAAATAAAPDATAATAQQADGAIQLQLVDELSLTSGLVNPEASSGCRTDLEAYRLEITPKGVTLQATTDAGLFYGLQTLIQLTDPQTGSLQAAVVEDAPRFAYRGVMLDVSRHFRSKAFVEKQIRLMASYKMNRLHLHLTDAAGWRLQIDRYPRLTQLAAWRTDSLWQTWWDGSRHYCEEGTPGAYGGYYTKQDIREIVEYARRHCITIIPEIEMPAHSEEALTAYPELSCTHEPYKQADFCVGNEATFRFLEGVLDEVMELFPSHYIHVGGDEAGKASWPTCPLCQKRMKQEGLKDVNELQSYLIARMGRYLKAHGRDLLGWDEIMEGGLAEGATVMSWRGEQGGRRALESGHQVIMSPGEYCYLDSYQDAPPMQPEAMGGYLTTEKVYSYDPLPDTLLVGPIMENSHLMLGVQANIWTEYIPTEQYMEYMLYPRAIALAEVGWTLPEHKSWSDFRRRMENYDTDRLLAAGYNPFDLRSEIGNRPESLQPIDHLAKGKPIKFNAGYWKKYPANGEQTLTDGLCGGWTYGDGRWLAFVGPKRVDVVIDLEQPTEIHSIHADFMQICGPGVFMPARVLISASDDGEQFTPLQELTYPVVKDGKATFHRFGWEGKATTRYIRYQSFPDETYGGVHFTDEIVVR